MPQKPRTPAVQISIRACASNRPSADAPPLLIAIMVIEVNTPNRFYKKQWPNFNEKVCMGNHGVTEVMERVGLLSRSSRGEQAVGSRALGCLHRLLHPKLLF